MKWDAEGAVWENRRRCGREGSVWENANNSTQRDHWIARGGVTWGEISPEKLAGTTPLKAIHLTTGTTGSGIYFQTRSLCTLVASQNPSWCPFPESPSRVMTKLTCKITRLVCLSLNFNINEIVYYMLFFCVWLLLLKICLRGLSIKSQVCNCILFVCTAIEYAIVKIGNLPNLYYGI